MFKNKFSLIIKTGKKLKNTAMTKKNILILVFMHYAIFSNAQVNMYDNPTPLNLQSQYNSPRIDNSPSFAEKLLEQRIMQQKQEQYEKSKSKYEHHTHIYGGISHKTYLGCLTCNSTDSLSIWNSNGIFGKNPNVLNMENNIWNLLSPFGLKTNDLSPWCPTAQNPPAIVNLNGDFYGYFTANINKDKRTKIELFNQIAELFDRLDYEAMEDSLKKL